MQNPSPVVTPTADTSTNKMSLELDVSYDKKLDVFTCNYRTILHANVSSLIVPTIISTKRWTRPFRVPENEHLPYAAMAFHYDEAADDDSIAAKHEAVMSDLMSYFSLVLEDKYTLVSTCPSAAFVPFLRAEMNRLKKHAGDDCESS